MRKSAIDDNIGSQIIALYGRNVSIRQIALQFSLPVSTVRSYLVKKSVTIRGRSEAMKLYHSNNKASVSAGVTSSDNSNVDNASQEV